MPRIRQKMDEYHREDFLREIRCRQGYYNMMTQQALGDAMGMPKSTVRKRMLEPDTLTAEELRRMVKAIHPDPGIVLRFLGYEGKEIKKLLEAE